MLDVILYIMTAITPHRAGRAGLVVKLFVIQIHMFLHTVVFTVILYTAAHMHACLGIGLTSHPLWLLVSRSPSTLYTWPLLLMA